MAPNRSNTRSIVEDLPCDILRTIFAIYRSMCREREELEDNFWVNFEWMSIACVSRSWRSIALDYAQLWCTIRVSRITPTSVEFLRLQLKRSKSAPLEVEFDVDRVENDEEALLGWKVTCQLISAVVPRIRSLILRGSAHYTGTLLHSLTGCADHLESFTIECHCAIPSNIFAGGVPNLQRLTLKDRESIPWETALFQSGLLSKLVIHAVDGSSGERLSISQLHTKLLPLAGRLTSLCLRLMDHVELDATVHLPSLKSLRIDAASATIVPFLRSIRIPTTTTIGGWVGVHRSTTVEIKDQLSSVIHSTAHARSSGPLELTHLSINSQDSTARSLLPYTISGWVMCDGKPPRYSPNCIVPSNIEPIIDFEFDWETGHGPVGGWYAHPFCFSELGFDLSQLVSLETASFYGHLVVFNSFWDEIGALPRLSMLATQGFDLTYFTHCLKMDSLAIEIKQVINELRDMLPSTAKDKTDDVEVCSTAAPYRYLPALKSLTFNNVFPFHHIPPSEEPWNRLQARIGDSDDEEKEDVWKINEQTVLSVQKAHQLVQNLLKNVQFRKEIGSPLKSIDFGQYSSRIVTTGTVAAFEVFVEEVNAQTEAQSRADSDASGVDLYDLSGGNESE